METETNATERSEERVSGIHSRAVLVKLKISQWDGFKRDERVSSDVDHRYRTMGDAGKYNKRLFTADVLRPIHKAANRIRTKHVELTLPWAYDGVSLLTNRMFLEYTSMIREEKAAFESAVRSFVNNYDEHKRRMEKRLGELYSPLDYPPASHLEKKFDVSIQFFPVPQSGHFVVDLEQEIVDSMRTELDDELVATRATAVDAIKNRLISVLTNMCDRLRDPEKVFRDSTIEMIGTTLAAVPDLNVFEDPEVTNAAQRIQNEVLRYNPQKLRVDVDARRSVVAAADSIITYLCNGDTNDGLQPEAPEIPSSGLDN